MKQRAEWKEAQTQEDRDAQAQEAPSCRSSQEEESLMADRTGFAGPFGRARR
ncbi:MAG: hypothetical protein JSW67_07220 [Candidatus Latescibacterota bacterium]|nr:MAG: hypothetical protein JSW67_07220 [Candidatus Latescibacterota bacterium]